MAGIYIHIPFCKQACHYCDFHFSINTRNKNALVKAIGIELALQKSYLNGEEINTIYFGGGTPSLLTFEELSSILNIIYSNYAIVPGAEITLEANPDDLSIEKLTELKKTGVNRLSIGIQSFNDSVLQFLNRAHNSTLAFTTFKHARKVGFTNISIDLMYNIPGQDFSLWKENIHHALALEPEHISSYSLTIEEKTVFGKWAAKKILSQADNDNSATELTFLVDELEKAGFAQYEVSNFCKPGYISKHNSNYWRGEKYLGIGPSAHSYNSQTRQFNIHNNAAYIRSVEAGQIPATLEILTRDDKINDWLLTTLRTSWGTDLKKLRQEYAYDLLKDHGDYVQSLIDHNYASLTNESLILTKSGRLLADKIASDLFSMTYS
jgi:oxygen-independent coproporphyrinogen III oxidase